MRPLVIIGACGALIAVARELVFPLVMAGASDRSRALVFAFRVLAVLSTALLAAGPFGLFSATRSKAWLMSGIALLVAVACGVAGLGVSMLPRGGAALAADVFLWALTLGAFAVLGAALIVRRADGNQGVAIVAASLMLFGVAAGFVEMLDYLLGLSALPHAPMRLVQDLDSGTSIIEMALVAAFFFGSPRPRATATPSATPKLFAIGAAGTAVVAVAFTMIFVRGSYRDGGSEQLAYLSLFLLASGFIASAAGHVAQTRAGSGSHGLVSAGFAILQLIVPCIGIAMLSSTAGIPVLTLPIAAALIASGVSFLFARRLGVPAIAIAASVLLFVAAALVLLSSLLWMGATLDHDVWLVPRALAVVTAAAAFVFATVHHFQSAEATSA